MAAGVTGHWILQVTSRGRGSRFSGGCGCRLFDAQVAGETGLPSKLRSGRARHDELRPWGERERELLHESGGGRGDVSIGRTIFRTTQWT
jgi:hypothetical protein